MAAEIRRTYSGTHPSKTYHPRSYYKPGAPTEHHAQVLAVVGDGKVAISMNGTAVMTIEELRKFFLVVLEASRPGVQ